MAQFASLKGKRFIVSGGGTGGHFYPALAIMDHLQSRGAEICYIGSMRGIESEFPHDSYRCRHLLPAEGWNRTSNLSLLRSIPLLCANVYQGISIIRHFRPHAAIITGGYASIAAGCASVLTGTPLYIQEQNSFPGLTPGCLLHSQRGFSSVCRLTER
ncbi:MAG: glycosyltransferase [Candidatus Wallbacteria bacterium]|nr:glycosyltransferase [Candidatus Wallbacteria bacterium]